MAIVQNVWFFFQDQILGMKWLNALIGNLLTALGLDISSRIGGAVQFFSMTPSRFLSCCLF